MTLHVRLCTSWLSVSSQKSGRFIPVWPVLLKARGDWRSRRFQEYVGVALLLLSIVMNVKNKLFLFLQWKQDGNLWEESRGMLCTCQLLVVSFRVHALYCAFCFVIISCILITKPPALFYNHTHTSTCIFSRSFTSLSSQCSHRSQRQIELENDFDRLTSVLKQILNQVKVIITKRRYFLINSLFEFFSFHLTSLSSYAHAMYRTIRVPGLSWNQWRKHRLQSITRL